VLLRFPPSKTSSRSLCRRNHQERLPLASEAFSPRMGFQGSRSTS
jgi:hypothetical protein